MLEYRLDAYAELTDKVSVVTAAGGKVTQRYQDVDARYDEYQYRATGWIHELLEAVVNGEPIEKIRQLHALTLADAVGSVQGTAAYSASGTATDLIDKQVRDRIAAELIREYATVSNDNLKLIGELFNKDWAEFVSVSKLIDPEVSAESIVGIDQKVQQAWIRSLELSKRLNTLLNALRAAADLAGVRGLHDIDSLIGLACPTSGVGKERRALWAAWDAEGRTGRWGALVAADVDVVAIDAASKYRGYARPRQEVKAKGGAQYWVDPEDGEVLELVQTRFR